ncbi:MAG: hypothetical protein LUC91_05600, partial [Prevotella sp.]|nr:hypothetical protein [Prevotella sp.]
MGRSNRLVKTFGTSSDEKELLRLEEEARLWIDEQKGESQFDYDIAPIKNASDFDRFITKSVYGPTLVGPDMVYGRLFDKIGYNMVQT